MKDMFEVDCYEVTPFDEFWSRYPRKCAKSTAKKAFAKIPLSEHNKIIEDISRRLELGDWDLKNKQFIPHPSTYLNQERWNDEIISKGNRDDHIRSFFEQELAPVSGSLHEVDGAKLCKPVRKITPY